MEEVLFTQEGQLGLITLNRPSALNALSLAMILALQKQLGLWKEDPSIKAVVIKATPGTAFCAGGDVRWLYNSGKRQDPDQLQFFWHEYQLNYFIHHLGKPYIALMDGMTMGGGVGISLHGSHPVASERFSFAMPETSIGFFPDIGASHLLSNCSGYSGIYLGLTGQRIGADEALKLGLVKYKVASEAMDLLLKTLMETDLSHNVNHKVSQCIDQFTVKQVKESGQLSSLIEPCFGFDTVELISNALKEQDDPWAIGVAALLDQKSPLSLKVTLAQLQKAEGLNLGQCLKMDYDLVQHFMQDKDFYEGVRALLIDKDKKPVWNPRSLKEVTQEKVANYFEPSAVSLSSCEL